MLNSASEVPHGPGGSFHPFASRSYTTRTRLTVSLPRPLGLRMAGGDRVSSDKPVYAVVSGGSEAGLHIVHVVSPCPHAVALPPTHVLLRV